MRCRCPHCHNPIEIVADDPLIDIECPSCGSHFALVGDQSTASYHNTPKTLAHFELLDQVGTGTFGTVWKARDIKLDRIVALKIPRAGQLEEAETAQFLREARAAAQVKHPNIVSVHEIGREDGTIYIVSDFIDGANLKEYISGQPLSFREAAELCATVADALHAAHEAGVIHRDLKPQNIMMDANGTPHVADFGLAKREAGEITMTVDGQILGTPAYMPPEQAIGKAHEADRRADVYSLGVILYELLTGELPFRGQRQMVLLQIQRDEPIAPRKLNNRVPRDLETICLKSMEKDCARRFQTAGDLAADCRRYLNGQLIKARRVGSVDRAWRWCKRNTVVSGLSAGLLLALTLGLLGTGVALRRERSARAQQELQLYWSRVNLAYVALNSGDRNEFTELMRQLVAIPMPSYKRGIEWRHLLSREKEMQLGEETTGAVLSLSFSPTGQLAIGCDDGSVILRGASSEESPIIPAHVSGHFASFSSTGKYLVTSGVDLQGPSPARPRIWRFPAFEKVVWDPPVDDLSQLVMSHDETLVAVCRSNDLIEVRKLLSGELINQFEGTQCALSGDGSRLATVFRGERVSLWDVKSGKLLDQIGSQQISNIPAVVAFAPDGSAIIAGGHYAAKLWTVSDDRLHDSGWRLNTETYAIAFSTDGYFALGCSDQTVKIWNLSDVRWQVANLLNTSTVTAVAFSQDNERLAAGTRDKKVQFWDSRVWKNDHVPVSGAHIHPPLAVSSQRILAFAVNRNGTESLKLWDPSDGDETTILGNAGAEITSAAFSANGKLVACSDFGGRTRIFDVNSGTLIGEYGSKSPVWCLAFSKEGQLAAGGTSEVLVWDKDDFRTGEPLKLDGPTHVASVTFSPHGHLAVGGGQTWNRSGEIKVWELEASGPDCLYAEKCPETVRDAAFSPDGSQMAIIYEFSSGVVRVVDALTWSDSFDLQCHPGKSTQVAFAGDRLITGSDNGTLRFWDLRHEQPVGTLRVGGKVRNLAMFPNENAFATAIRPGWVQVWRATAE